MKKRICGLLKVLAVLGLMTTLSFQTVYLCGIDRSLDGLSNYSYREINAVLNEQVRICRFMDIDYASNGQELLTRRAEKIEVNLSQDHGGN